MSKCKSSPSITFCDKERERWISLLCGGESFSVRNLESSVPAVRRLAILVNRLKKTSSLIRVPIGTQKVFEKHETSQSMHVWIFRGPHALGLVDLGAIQGIPVCVEQMTAIFVKPIFVRCADRSQRPTYTREGLARDTYKDCAGSNQRYWFSWP